MHDARHAHARLTVRPDPDRVLKPYVHPVLQKK